MKAFHDKNRGIGIVYDDICLINGARTPFGKFCGTLSNISPIDLGIFAAKGAIEKSGLSPEDIDQAFVSNIGQSCGDAYFLPRHIALYAGLPVAVPALMVQRICASGLETIIAASEQITLGKADNGLCCGTENMSLAPTVSFGGRMGYPLGKVKFQDMLWEALDDTAAGYAMGQTAENLALQYKIPRERVDAFAKLSHDRAQAASERGFFKEEIISLNSTVFERQNLSPRKVRLPGKTQNFTADENIRPTQMEILAKLPPAFLPEGVQTAGNSSGIVDGAASVVVASGSYAEGRKLNVLSRIVASASNGVDPRYMGIGPVQAIRILLEMTGLSIRDIGLFEINEAFGAQCLACADELRIPEDRLNVNGGAIAFGHPLGATGTRLALTLSRQMKEQGLKYGIASACIGGGQGTAVLFENLKA